jgi:hypothetical protein
MLWDECHAAVSMLEYQNGFGLTRIDPREPRWHARIVAAREARRQHGDPVRPTIGAGPKPRIDADGNPLALIETTIPLKAGSSFAADAGTPIETIRGKEGYRVRSAYQRAAAEFGLEWHGRNYDPKNWDSGDPLNRGLSAGSACLNGLVHAGVVSTGYCAAVGFIHTGKMLSFVYDIADLYKVDLIVPLVFQTVADGLYDVERNVRLRCRDAFHKAKLLERILPDIREVLDGRDDSGTGPRQPEGRSESLDARTEGRNLPRPHDRPHP